MKHLLLYKIVTHSDLELMKLLLGEDMSGHGKGVSSALTLSNAITNLAGFFFSISSILYSK